MTASEFEKKYGREELVEYASILRNLSVEERAALAARLEEMAARKRAEIADLEAELASILEDKDAMRCDFARKELV